MDYINKIHCGNCTDILYDMPNESIDMIITSPPYDNLRDYHGYDFNFEVIARYLFNILKPGGVMVWVVGDAVVDGSETGTSFRQALYFIEIGFNLHDTMIYKKNSSAFPANRKANRYTQIFEYMFILSNGKPKTANLICDKKNKWAGSTNWGVNTEYNKNGKLVRTNDIKPVPEYSVRNNIWKYSTGFNKTGHPAVFPYKLAEDHILTWSNEGDIILDPMCGSGTSCVVAKKLNRKYIGIDISKEYVDLTERRIHNDAGLL